VKVEADQAVTVERESQPSPDAIHVLHVSQPVTEGVAGHVARLAADQIARGWSVVVACPPSGDLPEDALAAGADHVSWTATRLPLAGVPAETMRLRKIVMELRPDVVHLHSSKAGLDGRLAIRGRLATVFQPNAWSFAGVRGALRHAALAWERAGARWADAIVCVSESERQLGETAGIDARWYVIPNGIDLARFHQVSDGERKRMRERLRVDAGPLAMCIGRLTQQKGQDVLIEAWPLVRARIPDATLVFVGDGPQRADLERRAGPGAMFVGRRRDVPELLAAADVVVQPSRWEGMAFTMLEAMARGRSVVATDAPGAREALGADAGAIVPVGAVQPLADAVSERLLDPDLTAREGRNGRRRAERAHDVRLAAEDTAMLYRDVLARRSPAAAPRRRDERVPPRDP
jgi:glycosyltransferase involved in cell wall biosynthesis